MITVIIPAYNASRYLAEAIGSVRAQEDVAVEIVVVDDGSTDDTAAIAKASGSDVRVISQDNGGAATALQENLQGWVSSAAVWRRGSMRPV